MYINKKYVIIINKSNYNIKQSCVYCFILNVLINKQIFAFLIIKQYKISISSNIIALLNNNYNTCIIIINNNNIFYCYFCNKANMLFWNIS